MPVIPIAVADPVPLYRRGLLTAFGNGRFRPEDPADLEAWTQAGGPRVLLVTTGVPGESDALHYYAAANHDLTVVALLREPTVDNYVLAMQAGVAGAASWTSSPETVVQVVEAACARQWLLPLDIARRISDRITVPPEARGVSAAEAKWLQLMAGGMTVAALAREVGYSEREMFRLLHDLYGRMAARNRAEALVKAAQWGLIT